MPALIHYDDHCYALPKRKVALAVRLALSHQPVNTHRSVQLEDSGAYCTSVRSACNLFATRNTLLPTPASGYNPQ